MATVKIERAEAVSLRQAREAQALWAKVALRRRLRLLRRVRHRIAETAEEMARSIPNVQPGALHRSLADTLVAEVLPLVEACRFLEREASWILAPQRLSAHLRPFWLRRVTAETLREPVGVVLILAPANYPLFLPGVQVLQALTAGNAVLWKPAPGGAAAAEALRSVLVACGLDPALLQLVHEAREAAVEVIAEGVDKVFLTGSAETGVDVLRQLASHLTPAVMELSGCDAVFVLPGAEVERAVAAVLFGLRLNGSATCMAPRRLFLIGDQRQFLQEMMVRLRSLPPAPLSRATREQVEELLDDARELGGAVLADELPDGLRYAIILRATPQMKATRADIFAPVLSFLEAADVEAAVAAHRQCPFALTAAVFGPEDPAHALAAQLSVGTVLINDLIVATADPRIAFGGRGSSGFGVTRGRDGLLEMTVLKTIVTNHGRSLQAYRPVSEKHVPLFSGYLEMVHGGGLRERVRGLVRMIRAAARLGKD